jgi:hypothetical protein
VKRANRWSTQLPHRLNRSGGVPEPDRPTSGDGSTDDGGGVARDGVGEVGGMVVVCGTSGPWGQPRGLTEMRVIRRITGAPMGLVTTMIRHSSFSSSSPSSSPDGLITKARGPMQLSWGIAPSRGWHTAGPNDPMERRRGSRDPSTGMPPGRGKGTGPLQHSAVWRSRRRYWWWCRGEDQVIVAPATMTTASAVAWGGDRVKQCQNKISKPLSCILPCDLLRRSLCSCLKCS